MKHVGQLVRIIRGPGMGRPPEKVMGHIGRITWAGKGDPRSHTVLYQVSGVPFIFIEEWLEDVNEDFIGDLLDV